MEKSTRTVSLKSVSLAVPEIDLDLMLQVSRVATVSCVSSLSQGADTHSTGKLLVAIVKICFENKEWDKLNENIILLTKRRGQIRQVKESDKGESLQ